MASVVTFPVLPSFATSSEYKPCFRVRAQSSGGEDPIVSSSDSFIVNGDSVIREKEKNVSLIDVGSGKLKPRVVEKKLVKDVVSKDLEVLWDDGYGTKSFKDYFDAAKEMIKPDGGPPRWFCPVDCGCPTRSSLTLLFLPGFDGIGFGLILHHRALGTAFEVRCLHIPVYDRTPFEGLVKFVEETVRLEHASSPSKPIYLVGDSIGGCLALAVAARNPTIDLVLILANPATSFGSSQLQLLLPILEDLPDELHGTVPYLLSFFIGNPLKMAMANIEKRLPFRLQFEQLSANLAALLGHLSAFVDIIPKDTLVWKMKFLKSASAYANSRLHAVKAEVLVLSSGNDNMLPSGDEGKRLKSSLQNCRVRYFKDNGHSLLMEDSISLLAIIKGTCKYRHSRKLDPGLDFLPPSMTEFTRAFDHSEFRLIHSATSPVMLSTLEDGKIVKGLAGVPKEGPVLLVGYHMLLGCELFSLVEEFLKEKNIMIRGLAHPDTLCENQEDSYAEFSIIDWVRVFGAVSATARNLFKVLSTKSHILLYPGGTREALHYKGEEYKLFWPDDQEFVRLSATFGATIVPFGTVGEDDIRQLVLDYNDLMKIPMINDIVREVNGKIRDESSREVADQQPFPPVHLPKIPGRFYFLFGKPILTKGREVALQDKENANRLYLHIKSEVERSIDYLLKKREKDPYRSLIDRIAYRAIHDDEAPTFEL